MPDDTNIPAGPFKLRMQDVILALLFAAMALLPPQDPWELALIATLGILQLLEGRIPLLRRAAGRVTFILLQFIVGWVLIGYSGGIESTYYLVFLFPMVSAATYVGIIGTLAVSIAACAAYSSFLLFIDWEHLYLAPDQIKVFELRLLVLAITAVLVNSLGDALRKRYREYQALAAQLAETNANLLAAEATVRRSERLAALGQLSAGLAHELRNPLGSIRGSAEMLSKSKAALENPLAGELASIISSEVDRTNSLVTRFLDFARPLQPTVEANVDVRHVLDEAIRRAGVQVIRNYAPEVPPLPIDPELMEQVFLNLLSNAKEASPQGSPVTVRVRLSGDEAEISVIDRGVGIAAEKLDTIFNPFVTTKKTGVGLGLAIVAKIVDEHGGRLAVESEPGKGSTFRVLLPLKNTK